MLANRNEVGRKIDYIGLLQRRPHAMANVEGSGEYSCLTGNVTFHQTRCGVLVRAEIIGLPAPTENCSSPVFGFHIHEGCSCSGTEAQPFANARGHYNPENCMHPYHAGDMPPLFGNEGYALSIFLTDRFTVDEVIGKTVIIHAEPDDFTSQPSGNSGPMIACGQIRRTC